jgi:hypothetical protein
MAGREPRPLIDALKPRVAGGWFVPRKWKFIPVQSSLPFMKAGSGMIEIYRHID